MDVRIITPGIPDKKLIYKVTRSYYAGLAMQGVRIYEYTPGFIHAKQTFCDGVAATVGTINMDYRACIIILKTGYFCTVPGGGTDRGRFCTAVPGVSGGDRAIPERTLHRAADCPVCAAAVCTALITSAIRRKTVSHQEQIRQKK